MSRASNLAGFTTAIGVPANLNVGIITAITLGGSGANLTSLPAGQLTGALPAIDGSALTGTGVGTDGSINTSGIITATSFSGDGSALTGTGVGTDANIDTTGIITATTIKVSAGGSFSINDQLYPNEGQLSDRNIIINGAMNIAQRGTTATASFTAGYACDRWGGIASGGSVGLSQVALGVTESPGLEGHRYYLRMTNTTGSTGMEDYRYVQQSIESRDIVRSGWKYYSPTSFVTLSFWARASVSADFGLMFEAYDPNPDRDYVLPLYSLTANTWTKFTYHIPGNALNTFADDNSKGFVVRFFQFYGSMFGENTTGYSQWKNASWNQITTSAMGTAWAGTNGATWDLTGVQLEVGDLATRFDHMPFYKEIEKCKRFYQKTYNYETALGSVTKNGAYLHVSNYSSTDGSRVPVRFEKEMVKAPTVTIYATESGTSGSLSANTAGGGAFQDKNAGAHYIGTKGIGYVFLNAGGISNAYNSLYFHYSADAEL
jgi:hypothetical protein